MANSVTNLVDTQRRAVIRLTGEFEAAPAQESYVSKVVAANLAFSLNTNGQIMVAGANAKTTYHTTIKRIIYSITSAATVRLNWDGSGTPNSNLIAVLCGSGEINLDTEGNAVIPTPNSNSNGNILLSTAGMLANGGYTIVIDLHKDGRDYDTGRTRDPNMFGVF